MSVVGMKCQYHKQNESAEKLASLSRAHAQGVK